jgi:HD-GYP domain-containing protein (c-di-GMP phosphodiesterase class II)
MRRHPEIGYRMLKHIPFLGPALDIVLCHQERFDGTGYPRGLKAATIPLGARIFAVVDTFDAMTSDRPYRAALPIEAACLEIERCSGTQFDPRVAAAFLSIPADRWREIRELAHSHLLALDEQIRRVLG